MKPDWDKLGKHYADSDSVLIVDVDCTAAGQGVCQKMGVKGYPTIKYFMAGDKKGKDYQGGRDFASLKGFAEKTLNKASCNAVTKNGCKANEVAFIEKVCSVASYVSYRVTPFRVSVSSTPHRVATLTELNI
jgi:hypothetical protein